MEEKRYIKRLGSFAFNKAIGFFAIIALCFTASMPSGIAQTNDPSPYCDINDSDCNNSFDPEIASVSFGSFTNTSGCGTQDGVSYYDQLGPIQFKTGQTINGTIECPGADYNDHAISIWIDLDQNGVFDQSERVYSDLENVPSSTETSVHNVSFSIPSTAKPGITRMRIEVAEDDPIPADEPCEASYVVEDGEFEDYNVNICGPSNGPDLSVTEVVKPEKNRISYGIEDVKVNVRNLSPNPISKNQTVPFKINTNLRDKPLNVQYTFQQQLSTCEDRTIEIGTVGLKCDGPLGLSVVSNLQGDVNANNDSAVVNYEKRPIDAGFESGSFPTSWTRSDDNEIFVIDDCANTGQNSLRLDGETGITATSSTINLKGVPKVTIEWAYREGRNSCSGDDPEGGEGIALEYYDGSDWEEITRTDGGNNITNFKEETFEITKGLTDQFQLRLRIYSGTSGSFDSWLIDDLELIDPRKAAKGSRPQNLISGPDTIFSNSPIFKFNNVAQTGASKWSLGGNIVNETNNSVTVEYPSAGKDSIQLVTAGCFGLDTGFKEITIVEPNRAPKVEFFATENYADTNAVVGLRDLTEIGPNSWEWTIKPQFVEGDSAYRYVNNSTKTDRNPDVQFIKPGSYTVSLKASNAKGSNKLVKTEYVNIGRGYKMCKDTNRSSNGTGFLYSSNGKGGSYSENSKQTCEFLIQPNCADSVTLSFSRFDINNGTCQNGPNPDFIKVYDGTNTKGKALHTQMGFPNGFTNGNRPARRIKLTANSGSMFVVFGKNGCGNVGSGFKARWETYQSPSAAVKTKIQSGKITGPDTIFAQGSASFKFMPMVSGTDYIWQYPDQTFRVTSKNQINPVIRTDSGSKQVKMAVENCGFRDTFTKEVFAKPVKTAPIAMFSASRTEVKVGDTLRLLDRSKNGVTQWKWEIMDTSAFNFANGSDVNSANPYVTFNRGGQYRVALVASNPVGSDIKAKLNFITVNEPCIPAVADNNPDLGVNEFTLREIQGDTLINNISQYGSDGFSQFRFNEPATLEAGKKYIVSIQRNSSFNDIDFGVWLDVNNDLRVSKSERLTTGRNIQGPTYRDTIQIPKNVADVGETDLRIATNFANNGVQGCGPHSGGEFEDYQVKLVGDRTKPVLTLKGKDTLNVDPCGAAPDTGATANDLVAGSLSDQIVVKGLDKLGVVGAHKLIYSVHDGNGNKATKEQVVIVKRDTTSPNLSLKGDQDPTVVLGSKYVDPGFNATDPCGNLDSVYKIGDVDTEVLGSQVLTYKAMDKQGNMTVGKRTVNVIDTIAPQAELKGNDTVYLNVFEPYEEQGIVSTDNYLDSTVVKVSGSVNTNQVGTYNLQYTVMDADSNQVVLNRTVIVEDREAPSITQIPNGVVIQDVGESLTLPFNVSDNFYERKQITVEKSGSYFSTFTDGFPDSLGFYKAQYTYTDGSNNTDSVTIAIRVVDRVAPSVVLNGDQIVDIQKWQTYQDSLGVTYEVKDNYYDVDQLEIKRYGSYFDDYLEGGYDKGLYEIQYQAIDPSGNKSIVKRRGVNVTANPTGIAFENESRIRVYPNPTSGNLSIDISLQNEESVDIAVLNLEGKVVKEVLTGTAFRKDQLNIDLSSLSAGMYQIRIQTGDNVINRPVSLIK